MGTGAIPGLVIIIACGTPGWTICGLAAGGPDMRAPPGLTGPPGLAMFIAGIACGLGAPMPPG